MFEDDFGEQTLDSAILKPKGIRKTVTKKPEEPAARVSFSSPKLFPEKLKDPSIKKSKIYHKKRFWWSVVTAVIVVAFILIGIKIVGYSQKILGDHSFFSIFKNIGSLVTDSGDPLIGEEQGVVNILLLGIGGEAHEGGLLTDTIILASIKPKTDTRDGEISLLSIPRDFVVKLPEGLDWRKINSAYAYGEIEEKGQGQIWARNAVEEWTGVEIPYYALIDFAGFEQIVDDLGGIEINVDRTFTDSFYPDSQFGYLPTIKFEAGVQEMDGTRALQYARSRHGTNGEGTDFARSRRQQKILQAIKEKAGSLKISTSLSTINNILESLSDNFKTNLLPGELKRAYELTKEISGQNIFALSLDYDTGLICDETVEESGAAILTICPGTTRADVQQFVSDRFTVSRLRSEMPKILFLNSTKASGLASRAAEATTLQYSETETGNYPGEEISSMQIYDLSNGTKTLTVNYLKDFFEAPVSTEYPYLDQIQGDRPDIIVVLGTDDITKFAPQ